MIKVLLVDDQQRVRQGLRMLLALEPDFTVVGEAGDGITALALIPALQPHVVVMDVEMPGMDGLSATEALRALAPGSAVVVLTLHDDPATMSRARQAGAAAFICKAAATSSLTATIRQVASAQ